MYSLASFSNSDMTECASEFRKLGVGALSVQNVAQRIASYLFRQLGNDQTGRHDRVLVGGFLTRAYRDLDLQFQDCVRRDLACGPGSLDMKCLTWFGTASAGDDSVRSDLGQQLEEVLLKRTSFQDFIRDQTFPISATKCRRFQQTASHPGRILLSEEALTQTEP